MKSKLAIYYNTSHVRLFNDWFDFADYVKQENLAGRRVTIHKWEYVS